MRNRYVVFFFLLLYIQHRNKKAWLKKYIQAKKKEGDPEMIELAKNLLVAGV